MGLEIRDALAWVAPTVLRCLQRTEKEWCSISTSNLTSCSSSEQTCWASENNIILIQRRQSLAKKVSEIDWRYELGQGQHQPYKRNHRFSETWREQRHFEWSFQYTRVYGAKAIQSNRLNWEWRSDVSLLVGKWWPAENIQAIPLPKRQVATWAIHSRWKYKKHCS